MDELDVVVCEMQAIEDRLYRARRISEVIANLQLTVIVLSSLRRSALDELAITMSDMDIAIAIGVSRTRIGQLRTRPTDTGP